MFDKLEDLVRRYEEITNELTFLILCIGRYQRLIRLFLHKLPEPVLIIYHRRLCQQADGERF